MHFKQPTCYAAAAIGKQAFPINMPDTKGTKNATHLHTASNQDQLTKTLTQYSKEQHREMLNVRTITAGMCACLQPCKHVANEPRG